MIVKRWSIVVCMMIMLAGCDNLSDPLEKESFQSLDSTISIQIVGNPGKPGSGSNAIISPNGMGSFYFQNEDHKIGRAKRLYSDATSLLGPLQNYSGNFEGVDDLARKMDCGNHSKNIGVALIFWEFDSKAPLSDERTWENVSQYDLSCDSVKSQFATKRIKTALEKFENHVARTK